MESAWAASTSGVETASGWARTSAPQLSKARTIVVKRQLAAIVNAVRCCLSSALTLAPRANSVSTTSSRPAAAASIKGVCPLRPLELTSAPLASWASICAKSPCLTARCRRPSAKSMNTSVSILARVSELASVLRYFGEVFCCNSLRFDEGALPPRLGRSLSMPPLKSLNPLATPNCESQIEVFTSPSPSCLPAT